MLHIAGLGPGNPDDITVGVSDLIRNNRTILRTGIHPTVEELRRRGLEIPSLDSFYEEGSSFEEIYEKIANEVIRIYEEEESDLVYAVP